MEFELKGEYIELNKLLKIMSMAESGGEANAVITEGKVKLNGNIEIQKRKKIRIGDKITYKGNSVIII